MLLNKKICLIDMVSFLIKSSLLALSEVSILAVASRPHIIMIVADDLVRIRNTARIKKAPLKFLH